MLDALLQLSAAQAVTATAVSTNTIDLGQSRDIAGGRPLYAVVTVDQTVLAAGAATVTFQVITSANANLSSPTVIAQSDAIGKAELTAGRRAIAVQIPPSVLTANPLGQRYLGVQYTVGTGPLTAGAFTCYLTDHVPAGAGKTFYPGNYTVA